MNSISYLNHHDIDQSHYISERYHKLLREENGGRLTETQQRLLDLCPESLGENSNNG